MDTMRRHDVMGVVLAGVHRWRDLTFDRLLPRPLMPVANSPLICFGLRRLRDAGITNVTICANSDSFVVRSCLEDGERFGLRLSYFEDRVPRGPAGCVRDAALATGVKTVVVVEGSAALDESLDDLLDEHAGSRAALTVAAQVRDPADGAALAPSGVYVLSRDALLLVSAHGYQDLKEVLIPRLHREGATLALHRLKRPCVRVDGLATYFEANERALETLLQDHAGLAGYSRRGDMLIHSAADVSPLAILEGPLLIGPGARVGARAALVGPVVLADGARIDPDTLVSRSVLWSNTWIERGASVDRCVLGADAHVPAGAIESGAVIAHGRRPLRDAEDRRSRVFRNMHTELDGGGMSPPAAQVHGES